MSSLISIKDAIILEQFGNTESIRFNEEYLVTEPCKRKEELADWVNRFRNYLKQPYILASFQTEVRGKFGPQTAKRYGLFMPGKELK